SAPLRMYFDGMYFGRMPSKPRCDLTADSKPAPATSARNVRHFTILDLPDPFAPIKTVRPVGLSENFADRMLRKFLISMLSSIGRDLPGIRVALFEVSQGERPGAMLYDGKAECNPRIPACSIAVAQERLVKSHRSPEMRCFSDTRRCRPVE